MTFKIIKKTYIIAEAGVNHNGDYKLAKKLISKAAQCKAYELKFQIFKANDICLKEFLSQLRGIETVQEFSKIEFQGTIITDRLDNKRNHHSKFHQVDWKVQDQWTKLCFAFVNLFVILFYLEFSKLF
jgi:sialic acid synthase SpsE